MWLNFNQSIIYFGIYLVKTFFFFFIEILRVPTFNWNPFIRIYLTHKKMLLIYTSEFDLEIMCERYKCII